MSLNGTTIIVDPETVSNTFYDVVIVGTGIAGSIIAKQLSEQGKNVLILEASLAKGLTIESFQKYVNTFYGAIEKNANSPYPVNPNVLSPTDDDIYFVEKGPMRLSGSYTRIQGGTTMHWEAKTPRMLPEDFELYTKYGQGLNWPISYDDIEPYYCKAEAELGICGDVEEQKKLGVKFQDGYVFPMYKLPPSYLDQKVIEKVEGTPVQLYGKTYHINFSTFPQARNGVPNPNYKYPGTQHIEGNGFVPDGLTSINPVQYGERCQGNANCVPICPVQAKYDARRTLKKAFDTGRVHILYQAVASRVEYDRQNGNITGIEFKHYKDQSLSDYTTGTAKGELYVLATNAVENARLLLSSDLPNTSGMIGRHLMDHPFTLAWALMPEVTGTMRGPLVTSGIGTFRSGEFRRLQSSFAVDIHNDGWGWATGGATPELKDAVDNKNKYGQELQQTLISRISRQLLLAFMCELLPEYDNRVSIDPNYTDKLGNYRPVINYNLPDYSRRTLAYTRKVSRLIFQRLGAEDYTHYDPQDPAYFEFEGEGYAYKGGNHFSGTHIMGLTPQDSVVDSYQCSWDHKNLYIVGAGSMPSIGSSNTTLTLAALSFRTAEQVLNRLNASKVQTANV